MIDGATRPSKTALLVAYATLYIVWGSTYLAIRIAVESWTPMMMAAVRFAIAGVGLYGVLRLRGVAAPTRKEWGTAVLVGGLMLAGGNGTVCWAEQWVPSGETALILAQGALWMVLLPWFARRAPAPRPIVLAGVAVGVAGVAVLVAGKAEGAASAVTGGAVTAGAGAAGGTLFIGRLALIGASMSWVVGSLLSRGLPMPASISLASAMQMLAATPILLVAALLHGDAARFSFASVPPTGWAALLYLVVFGSLAGFGSYLFLLKHEGPTRTSTNAFVNPLVAVALGAALAAEPITARTLIAAAMIIAAVAAVIWGTATRRAPR
jgi:drug/metabolite transporter (DMT)-like permease